MFEIHASGFAHAGQRQAWKVLTDYDRLHEFVPDLQSSALLWRNDREAIVEQHSRAGFLFLSQRIRLVVRVTEQPYSAIDVGLVAGDMRSYSAHWELVPSVQQEVNGTRIVFSGSMEPDFFVPPLIGESIVRMNATRMIESVLAEMERRGEEK